MDELRRPGVFKGVEIGGCEKMQDERRKGGLGGFLAAG
jgi:hypothetical protein